MGRLRFMAGKVFRVGGTGPRTWLSGPFSTGLGFRPMLICDLISGPPVTDQEED